MNTTHVVSPALRFVIPAQAGIHSCDGAWPDLKMDSRLRGNDMFYDGVTHDI